MKRRRLLRIGGIAAGGLALAAAAEVASYPLWRAWCLNWGATSEEAAAPLPGDELLPDAEIVSTRANWIDAPPAAIWPWLVWSRAA